MSGTQARLGKLYPALTAKERAILVLKAWKEDGEEDPLVRETMPAEQAADFNRLIDLMNGVNVDLATRVITLYALVGRLGAKWGWLATVQVWGLDACRVAAYVFLHTKEPVTESEHRTLVRNTRSEMVPARELAEILVERHDGWSEADMEGSSDEGDDLVSDEAWDRVRKGKEKEIARLVEDGTLKGERKGRRMLVNAGAFYDWLGEPAPVSPEWGLEFEVFPDEDADKVRRLRKERQAAREAISGAPSDSAIEPVFRRYGVERRRSKEVRDWGDQIADALSKSLWDGIQECWQVLRAIELAVHEVEVEFDGEYPLLPEPGAILEGARKELEDMHQNVQRYVEPFELPEPDEEVLARVKSLARLADEG